MAGEHTLTEPKLMVTPDVHLHPLTNVPTKCQPSTSYGIQEIAHVYWSRPALESGPKPGSTRQGEVLAAFFSFLAL